MLSIIGATFSPVGIILYELLSGRKPFAGESPTAVMLKIISEDPPPLASLVNDLPPRLVEAVNRALKRNPGERFQSASELASELHLVRRIASSFEAPKLKDFTERLARRAGRNGLAPGGRRQSRLGPASDRPEPAHGPWCIGGTLNRRRHVVARPRRRCRRASRCVSAFRCGTARLECAGPCRQHADPSRERSAWRADPAERQRHRKNHTSRCADLACRRPYAGI